MLVVIIIGGIYSGLFTATEAAAMAAIYSFFVSVFVYKALKFKDVPKVLLNSANMSAMLLYIITNAVLFSFILTNENIPNTLAHYFIGENMSWVTFLLIANVLLLLAGNFMEPSSLHPHHGADPLSDRREPGRSTRCTWASSSTRTWKWGSATRPWG